MEKVVCYKIYTFMDTRLGERYYFEDQFTCEKARFCAYSKYDKQRLSINNFIVPVTKVEAVLVPENKIKEIQFCNLVENEI